MNIKMKIAGCLLGFSSLFMATQANANVVRVVQNPDPASVGTVFDLEIQGSFTDTTIGGGFTLSWDSTVLDLLSDFTAIEASLVANGWDDATSGFSFIEPVNTTATPIHSIAIDPATFAGDFTGNFAIVSLQFQAATAGVTSADLTLDPFLGSDWSDVIGDPLAVTYEGTTVNISAVPVPAAVWLFGSGLIGLVGVARRSQPQLV